MAELNMRMLSEDSLLTMVLGPDPEHRYRDSSGVVGYSIGVELMEILIPVKTFSGLPLPVLENPLLLKHVRVVDGYRKDVIQLF